MGTAISKKLKILSKKCPKSGPKSGPNPVRFQTVIREVTCFRTVFFSKPSNPVFQIYTVQCHVSHAHILSIETHENPVQTNKLTGHPDFGYPTNVRALRAKMFKKYRHSHTKPG